MNRRSFLGLLAGTAALPVFAKIAALEPALPPAPAFPTIVRPRLPVRIVRYVVPLQSHGGVRPGGIDRIAALMQRAFRPDRLIISAGEAFNILHVAASGEPVVEDAVPGQFFSPLMWGTRLDFATVGAGEELVLAVHNVTNEWAPFNAALIGSCVQELSQAEHEADLAARREYADKIARGEATYYVDPTFAVDDDDDEEQS